MEEGKRKEKYEYPKARNEEMHSGRWKNLEKIKEMVGSRS
jgi:hypothetical protein